MKKEKNVLYAWIGEKGRGMSNTPIIKPYKSDFMLMVERESRKQTLKEVYDKFNDETEELYKFEVWLRKEIKKLGE